jgi:hypothetical protein
LIVLGFFRCFVLHFWDRISLCSLDWPRAHSITQAGMNSQVPGRSLIF